MKQRKSADDKLTAKVEKLEKKSEKLRKLIGKSSGPQLQLLLLKLQNVADKLESLAPSKPITSVAPRASAPASRQYHPAALAAAQSAPLSAAEDFARRSLRQQRFAKQSLQDGEQLLLDEAGGKGTSEALEKEYLRLTALPVASNVRPAPVLAKALKLVQAKWKDGAEYSYACEQLKSIRQDLTVQHIRGDLAVKVYETHARIAIEVGDWAEFKRCLTMLKQLYSEGQPGNHEEFAAYGLMLAAQHGADLYSRELVQLPEAILAHPFVQHAMSVCWAFRAGQPRAFNSLYPTAQRMAGYLMDQMLDKVRAVGLRALLVAFYPTGLPLSYVASELGFDEDADAAQFLRSGGVVVEGSTGVVDTKASRAAAAGPPRPR